MGEYIDRDKLIAEYDRVHVGEPGGARKLMVEAPAADVVAVKHGEWEKFQGERFICNCCARVFNLGSLATLSDVKRLWKYCPNCGAKMDEERKEKCDQ